MFEKMSNVVVKNTRLTFSSCERIVWKDHEKMSRPTSGRVNESSKTKLYRKLNSNRDVWWVRFSTVYLKELSYKNLSRRNTSTCSLAPLSWEFEIFGNLLQYRTWQIKRKKRVPSINFRYLSLDERILAESFRFLFFSGPSLVCWCVKENLSVWSDFAVRVITRWTTSCHVLGRYIFSSFCTIFKMTK